MAGRHEQPILPLTVDSPAAARRLSPTPGQAAPRCTAPALRSRPRRTYGAYPFGAGPSECSQRADLESAVSGGVRVVQRPVVKAGRPARHLRRSGQRTSPEHYAGDRRPKAGPGNGRTGAVELRRNPVGCQPCRALRCNIGAIAVAYPSPLVVCRDHSGRSLYSPNMQVRALSRRVGAAPPTRADR